MNDLARLRDLLAKRLGLQFDDKRGPQLEEVLRTRAGQHGLSARGYLDRLATAWHAELAALAEAVTINETYFFRNIEQFDALAEVALPERVRARGARTGGPHRSAGRSPGDQPRQSTTDDGGPARPVSGRLPRMGA